MPEKRVYTSVEDWWKDRKEELEKDLSNAENSVSDPEIIKIMKELLDRTKVSKRITDYYNYKNPGGDNG